MILRRELQTDAQNSNFEKIESTLHMKSPSMPLVYCCPQNKIMHHGEEKGAKFDPLHVVTFFSLSLGCLVGQGLLK